MRDESVAADEDDDLEARWREAGALLRRVAPDVFEALLHQVELSAVRLPHRPIPGGIQ